MLDFLVEQRLEQAVSRGAYRILKNAGLVPPELEPNSIRKLGR